MWEPKSRNVRPRGVGRVSGGHFGFSSGARCRTGCSAYSRPSSCICNRMSVVKSFVMLPIRNTVELVTREPLAPARFEP
eukprot:4429233-Pleurochrysis_carterae.AAC.3